MRQRSLKPKARQLAIDFGTNIRRAGGRGIAGVGQVGFLVVVTGRDRRAGNDPVGLSAKVGFVVVSL